MKKSGVCFQLPELWIPCGSSYTAGPDNTGCGRSGRWNRRMRSAPGSLRAYPGQDCFRVSNFAGGFGAWETG